MDRQEFEQLVEQVLEDLPREFQERLENVVVVVENWPNMIQIAKVRLKPGMTLFGLYEGVPKTRRGAGYTFVPPDKITIFQKPIEFFHRDPESIRQRVRSTVLHEIGHHFGMSEERLRKKK